MVEDSKFPFVHIGQQRQEGVDFYSIGGWYVDYSEEHQREFRAAFSGHFDMNKQKEIEGVTFDRLGLAVIRGRFTDVDLQFTKEYLKEFSHPEAAQIPILYTYRAPDPLNDDMWLGTYRLLSPRKTSCKITPIKENVLDIVTGISPTLRANRHNQLNNFPI